MDEKYDECLTRIERLVSDILAKYGYDGRAFVSFCVDGQSSEIEELVVCLRHDEIDVGSSDYDSLLEFRDYSMELAALMQTVDKQVMYGETRTPHMVIYKRGETKTLVYCLIWLPDEHEDTSFDVAHEIHASWPEIMEILFPTKNTVA